MTATSLATSGWLCDSGSVVIIIEARQPAELVASSRAVAALVSVERSDARFLAATRSVATLAALSRTIASVRAEIRQTATLIAYCGDEPMTTTKLEQLKVGDTLTQPFEWTDSAGDGIDLTDHVIRSTLRRVAIASSPVLHLATSYSAGGITIDPDQMTNAGRFILQIAPHVTETFPCSACLVGDIEVTSKGDSVSLSGSATYTLGSAVVSLSAPDIAALRPAYLIEVDGVLLAVVDVDVDANTITTDYVWPAGGTDATPLAWQGVRQTQLFELPTAETTTRA